MRRALILAGSILLAATSAPAQDADRSRNAAPGLRGALPARAPMSPIPAATPGAAALAASPRPDDSARCRVRCAQSYYFCAAADDPEACAPDWGRCRGACDAPRFTIPRIAGAR